MRKSSDPTRSNFQTGQFGGFMKNWTIGKRTKVRFDRWLRDYPRATPVGVFLVALILVAGSAWSVEMAAERTNRAANVVRTREIASAIERQVAANTAYFQATSALFLSAQDVSPDFFRLYIERLRVDYDLTGVVSLGWLEAVRPNELPQLQASLVERGFTDTSLAKSPDGSTQYIVTMIEPGTAKNLNLIGFNMHSDPRRAAAIERALRTKALAATDPVKLRVDMSAPGPTGFIVFLPVTSTNDERVAGFVYSAIRTADFIHAAVKPSLLETGKIEIYDTTADGEELIFTSGEANSQTDSLEQRLAVFDQQWVIRFHPLVSQPLYPLTLVVLVGGVSFSLLLLAYILLAQRRNEDLLTLVNAQAEREAERAAFVRELNHRVKNTLSNVTSIIALTRRNAKDMDSFSNDLLERVRALAASHSLLDGAQWGPTDLKALIEAQLASHGHAHGRIDADGPSVLVSPNDALSLGLALHELLTNATRYGALSVDEGKVHLHWALNADTISVIWEESGGPSVTEPVKRGFGLNLIERALAHELGQPIKIEFPSTGLRCAFQIPLRKPKSFQLRKRDKDKTAS
jgi:two-component sensor histidine kinase